MQGHVALLCKGIRKYKASTLGESVVDFTTWMYHDTKGSNIHLLINPLIHLIQHSVKLWRYLWARIRSSAVEVVFWLAHVAQNLLVVGLHNISLWHSF